MEFTIDVALVRDILVREHARASDEIRKLGVLRAMGESGKRHDARIAAAADVGTLACRAGCAWCCYYSVDVRAAEVFGILDFVERALAPAEQVRCPFLSDGRCAIYPVRPQSCRNYHATDAAGCEQSYDDPENLEIDPEFAPGVYQAGGAHVEAFSAAMQGAGFDVSAYELNGALDAALSQPGARARFESGLKPFAGLDGEEVAGEFDDLRP